MNRKLLKSIREYKRESILAPVFVVLEVLMEVLIPLQMSKIIDVGIQQGNLKYIIVMGLILVVMAMLALFFGAKAGTYAARAGAGYAKNLRHDIFYKIQTFSFHNIDHFSTSGLVTRLTTDITNLQMAYMMSIRLLARAPIMIILSLIMTMTINIPIAIILLVTIPILGGVLIFIAKKAHPNFIQVFDEYDVLNNTVQENVNAARVVKAYVREDYEIKKFHGISKIVYQLFTKAEKIVAWNSPVMQFAMYAVILLMVFIGGQSIVFQTMQPGELTSVIIYAIQILSSLMMVSFVFVLIMIAGASADRIEEVLDEIPELRDQPDAIQTVTNGDIDFENVDFSYAGKDGPLSLKNINLHIRSGQTIGIIGATGSAKSTLVQLIPRLYDVTKGSVKVGGVDVRKYGLAALIVQGGNNVSGGQKQRLCIARALLKKPKILILDDSTSAVDTKTDALIRKAFREEIPDTTKIIIAQRVSSVEDADQIIVMDDGRIDAVGTSEELLKTNTIYREVYESQMKGGAENE